MIAQHRRGLRSAGRAVKGAKTLWYRRDAQGFLWIPLTYQIAAAEQLPGAPYPDNITLAINYPLPLVAAGAATDGDTDGATDGACERMGRETSAYRTPSRRAS